MTDSISQRAAEQAELGAEMLAQLAQVAKQAAERGGAELMRHYGRIASVQSKGRAGDLVTNADLAAEALVLKDLQTATPAIAVLAEESGSQGEQDGLRWCIDPLDGTTNFAHGYPFFATSVGLTFRQQPILSHLRPISGRDLLGCTWTGSVLQRHPDTDVDMFRTRGFSAGHRVRLRPSHPSR